MKLKLIKTGSVKNIYTLDRQNDNLLFGFSNRYSLFDWGEMPDEIPQKGLSLFNINQTLFDFLECSETWKKWNPSVDLSVKHLQILKDLRENGLTTHRKKEVPSEEIELTKTHFTQTKESLFPAKRLTVPPLKSNSVDYEFYTNSPVQSLVPLEIIFRFDIFKNSSILERIKDASYIRTLETTKPIKEGQNFKIPLIEFSTKLEPEDRYLPYEEAQRLSGMTDDEFKKIKLLPQIIALCLKDFFAQKHIKLVDGKLEFGFTTPSNTENNASSRNFVLADSVGLDELRLLMDNMPLSKEILRNFYRKTMWFENTKKAKAMAKKDSSKSWKDICKTKFQSNPEKLPLEMKNLFSQMYVLASSILKGEKDFTSQKNKLLTVLNHLNEKT